MYACEKSIACLVVRKCISAIVFVSDYTHVDDLERIKGDLEEFVIGQNGCCVFKKEKWLFFLRGTEQYDNSVNISQSCWMSPAMDTVRICMIQYKHRLYIYIYESASELPAINTAHLVCWNWIVAPSGKRKSIMDFMPGNTGGAYCTAY